MDGRRAIGIFDSGYGGLTVFRSIAELMPQYDYLYLGDNARAPYGNRSFETVYDYTLQCMQWFIKEGCPLVILACNTASAKALRNLQQNYLPKFAPDSRILGVIRPTAEVVGTYSQSGAVGVLGTKGTIASRSYEIEITKFFPQMQVYSLACPMWVPLVENGEFKHAGADYFVEKYINELFSMSANIDTLLLACTHYPLLLEKIQKYTPSQVSIISQGNIVANSLSNYLLRHQSIDNSLTTGGTQRFYTTDSTIDFDNHALDFFGKSVTSQFLRLP